MVFILLDTSRTFLEQAASVPLNSAPLKLQVDLGVAGTEGIARGTISKEKVTLEGSIWEKVLGVYIPPEVSGCAVNTRKRAFFAGEGYSTGV